MFAVIILCASSLTINFINFNARKKKTLVLNRWINGTIEPKDYVDSDEELAKSEKKEEEKTTKVLPVNKGATIDLQM